MLRLSRGLDVVHVPFQGVGPAIVSTIAGQTHILLGGSPSILASQVKEGTLRALVISAAQRSPELPDVPTKNEAGIPEWGGGFWSGVFVPEGTPGKLIALLHRQIAQIMQQPDMGSLRAQNRALRGAPSTPSRIPPRPERSRPCRRAQCGNRVPDR
jgi:tripartite-type tricarboxylate transporter receptor subunit TctC